MNEIKSVVECVDGLPLSLEEMLDPEVTLAPGVLDLQEL